MLLDPSFPPPDALPQWLSVLVFPKPDLQENRVESPGPWAQDKVLTRSKLEQHPFVPILRVEVVAEAPRVPLSRLYSCCLVRIWSLVHLYHADLRTPGFVGNTGRPQQYRQ